jgi:tryptophan synthase alpha chain
MNKIDLLFGRLRRERKKALIVYITAGDPSLQATERLILEIEKSGADLIELGIPFSDPLADGPTIQKASQRALAGGVTVRSILAMARGIKGKVSLPLVFMTYYNLVMQYGVKEFIKDAKSAGIEGIIIPDLPPEEAVELIRMGKKENFSTIFLAAPTSSPVRLKIISAKSTGFIYYVSLTGVTGARQRLPRDIVEHVKRLKRLTRKPVCVGFGISGAGQAGRIASIADGVIVGSAIVKIMEKYKGSKELYRKVSSFVSKLARAVHSQPPK